VDLGCLMKRVSNFIKGLIFIFYGVFWMNEWIVLFVNSPYVALQMSFVYGCVSISLTFVFVFWMVF